MAALIRWWRAWPHLGQAAAFVTAVGVALLVFVTIQDASSNRALRVTVSAIPNAQDTGEVEALKRLAAGGRIEAADLKPSLAFAQGRNDGADFRLTTLLRARYAYGSAFSRAAEADLRAHLLAFPYWMDARGSGGPMVYWSENHQILFATSEFLAGGLYPDAVFGDGRRGAAHRAVARERILFWLEQRWRFGFSEWNSHYYVEDLAGLANLVDFAGDEEVARKAAIVLDLLMLDLASQSIGGEFIAASGRLYENNAKFGDEAVRRVLRHAFVRPEDPQAAKGLEINFLMSRYATPPVLRAIAADQGVAIVRSSSGRDLDELRSDADLTTEDRRIMAQWGMEAFTNPAGIGRSVRYAREHGLLTNPFLAGFRQLNYRALSATGALPWLSRALDLPTNGTILGRANTYAYRTPEVLMSTTQAYRPGGFGNQQRVFVTTFGPGVSLFHSHPAIWPGDPPPNGNSPGYWTGSGRLPLSCQDGPINLSLYRLPRSAGFGRADLLAFTHLYAPMKRFDRVLLENNRLFLAHRNAWVAVTAAAPLQIAGPSEIIQPGYDTFWVTEASSARVESFEAFVARIRRSSIQFDGRALTYRSAGRLISASFDRGCSVDGVALDMAYPRHASPYGAVGRAMTSYRLAFGGHTLNLDFKTMTRDIR